MEFIIERASGQTQSDGSPCDGCFALPIIRHYYDDYIS